MPTSPRYALVCFLLLAGCAASPLARYPASEASPSEESQVLAAKLSGQDLKFQTAHEGRGNPALGILSFHLKDCETAATGAMIECMTAYQANGLGGETLAVVTGDRYHFVLKLHGEVENNFSLDTAADVSFLQGEWHGNGTATGWVSHGQGASVLSLKESLGF